MEPAEAAEAAAEAAYEAYRAAVGGRDAYQHPLEPYGELHDVYKQAWRQAAQAALALGVEHLPPAPEVEPPAAHPATAEGEEESPPPGRRRR